MSILVDTPWLQAHLQDTDLVILDATVELPAPRFDGDYRASSGYDGWAHAHIPGARHADLLVALADTTASYSFALPAPAALLKGLAALGVSDGKTVVIYDRADGFWAARLWWMLRSVGIHASVLDGGFNAWTAAANTPVTPINTPVIPALPSVIPAKAGTQHLADTLAPASGKYDKTLWATRADIEAVVAGQAPGTLICALGTALFNGTAPTRYARRGHIPGSLNTPARTLFDAQGRYLPTDALALAIGPDLLQGDTPLILYCGGGISAAANALALTLLGRRHVAIYDGSLQEWAADARLPMTTGAPPA